jgi:hypothetical protein
MLGHDFQDMPGRSMEIGDNPHETTMLLRCVWCMKTPAKARKDGCAVHELQEAGAVRLSAWNPEGVERFEGRCCMTCERPIMEHWLRNGSTLYWCYENQNKFSDGMTETYWDVPTGFGIQEPSAVSEHTKVLLVCQHTRKSDTSMRCADCGKSYQAIAEGL